MTEQEQQKQILDMVAAGADWTKLLNTTPRISEYLICRTLSENGYIWDSRGIRKQSAAPTSIKTKVPESFADTLRDLISEYMGNDREDISPDGVMCILDDLEAKGIKFPEGMDQLAVRNLIAELDADRQMEATRPHKTNGKPVGKSAVQLAEFKPKRPADEVWYPCKSPASSYAVSSYAAVATLVGGRGTQIGKILKPRVSAPKGGRALLCVQIRTDEGQKRDYPVQWLFENARPKTPAEVARRRAYEKAKREAK